MKIVFFSGDESDLFIERRSYWSPIRANGLLPASLMAGFLWQWVNPQATFVVGSLFALTASILLVLTCSKPK